MDRQTVLSKTAKGLMEATGKTSALSRDMRALLKEIDGKATVGEVQDKFAKVPEAKLQQALEALLKSDYLREVRQAQAPAPPKSPPEVDIDLDFTMAIPTLPSAQQLAEEAAKQQAQAAAAAAAEAAARAKAEAEARAKAAAEAAARAKAAAETKAKAEAEARAKAEAAARAKREAEERARKQAEEAERKARDEAERQRKEAEEQARRVAEEQARKDAEEAERKAREAAELRAQQEAERQAREEAERKEREEAERQRKEAEEKARREAEEQARREAEEAERKAREAAELRAQQEAERRAREEAERKEREEAERQRKEAEEQARRVAEEQARKEAEEAERKAREAAELRAQQEAAELRAQQEAERQAREEAERKEREEAERQRKEAEEQARREAEEQERKEAEEAGRKAREEAEEHAQREAETRVREQAEKAERIAREEAELRAKEAAERKAQEEAERQRAEAEEKARAESAAREREAAEEAQRREHEETARKAEEAADRLRQEEEEQAQTPPKSRRSLDDLVKIETDLDAVAGAPAPVSPVAAQARDSAEDRMLKEVEENARRQSEAQAVREAEERARVEEQARADAEVATQPGAPDAMDELDGDYAREHAEAQARLSAQEAETERHFAEMEKELEAEQGAGIGPKETPAQREAVRRRDKDDAEAHFGAAAEARAIAEADAIAAEVRQTPVAPVYRTPIKWGRPVALVLFLLLVLAAVTVHVVSFDAYIPRFEKLAGAYLQQPVKIRALHLSLVPLPHWRLEGVSVGNEGQLKVEKVTATAELGSMFSDKMSFALIELESPLLGEQGMTGLLFGKPAGQDFKVVNIVVKNGKLDSNIFVLPALDAKISIAENGSWQKIALETPDRKTSLLFTPEGEGANLEVETNVFSLPFNPSFFLENFSAKGVIRRGELRLSELKGGIYGGFLSGSANLKWNADWSLSGKVSVRTLDPGRFAPALFEEGVLEGKAKYAMRANSYDELFAAPRLDGNFEMRKGALLGVDLGRLLQGGGVGGRTAYVELTGGFVREASKTQLRQIRLSAGPVTAGGSLDADSGKRINGRFAVELKSPVAQARSNLTLTGTLSDPRFSR